MNSRTRTFVAGGNTLVGKALLERLKETGHRQLLGEPPHEPDLTNRSEVERFFADTRPEVVYMAAGLSGGINANQESSADLMLDNLLVSAHVVAAAYHHEVDKLLYLGSSCMYPRLAAQPMRPEMLQTAPMEATSAAYATAKVAGLTLCQAYRRQHGAPSISGIPANAFGPHDNFSPQSGHVIPALIRRMHEAKLADDPVLDVWGTGMPRREFTFALDLADACIFVMRHYDDSARCND